MSDALSIRFDANDALRGLDEMALAFKDATRPSAQAGAEHLYFEARLRCPVSTEAHVFYGRDSKKTGVTYRFQPGNLRNSIYQVFSKKNSGDSRSTYHVSWNHRKAPYGYMVEYGTARAPAHPFVRPAYDAAADQALKICYAELVARVKGKGGIR